MWKGAEQEWGRDSELPLEGAKRGDKGRKARRDEKQWRTECQVLVGLLDGSGQFETDGLSGSSGERPSHPHAVVEVCEGRLRVIHGQHQAGAPHHQLVISVRQLPVQVVGGGGAGEGRAAARVGTWGVCADRDVAVGQVDVAVCEDEVGVVILQLALVLARGTMKMKNRKWLDYRNSSSEF